MPTPDEECVTEAEVQRLNMRRRSWTRVGEEELIRLLDLPPNTTVLAVRASIDPPGVTLALHNPAWPVQVPDAESPMLPHVLVLTPDGLKRSYGDPPAPVGYVGNDGRGTGKDPTYGRIDPDIQRRVDEMNPSSLGQRVAMEQTLQDRRGMRWPGCGEEECEETGAHAHNEDGDAYPIAPV